MRVIGTEFVKEWCLSAGKGGKKADLGRKEDTLEIAVFEVVLGRYCEGCESKKVVLSKKVCKFLCSPSLLLG